MSITKEQRTMQQNRVLIRLGARELSREEIEIVNGARAAHTDVCTLATMTTTGSGDGDGCSDMDSDH
jgi:hypothetical protein